MQKKIVFCFIVILYCVPNSYGDVFTLEKTEFTTGETVRVSEVSYVSFDAFLCIVPADIPVNLLKKEDFLTVRNLANYTFNEVLLKAPGKMGNYEIQLYVKDAGVYKLAGTKPIKVTGLFTHDITDLFSFYCANIYGYYNDEFVLGLLLDCLFNTGDVFMWNIHAGVAGYESLRIFGDVGTSIIIHGTWDYKSFFSLWMGSDARYNYRYVAEGVTIANSIHALDLGVNLDFLFKNHFEWPYDGTIYSAYEIENIQNVNAYFGYHYFAYYDYIMAPFEQFDFRLHGLLGFRHYDGMIDWDTDDRTDEIFPAEDGIVWGVRASLSWWYLYASVLYLNYEFSFNAGIQMYLNFSAF